MVRVYVPLVACAALAGGCDDGAPVPGISAIAPARAYTDRDLRLAIRGSGFLPSYRIDLGAGLRGGDAGGFSGRVGAGGDAVALRAFGWRSVEEMTATMDAGLPAGLHAVEVTDPRGHVARFTAFESLGADREPPDVDFDAPGADTAVGPGVGVTVRVRASDPDPGALDAVTWQATLGDDSDPFAQGECALDPDATAVACAFDVTVPERAAGGDRVEITVTASDRAAASNRTQASLGLPVRDRPIVSRVSPGRGGTGGGTDILIKGAGFLRGTRAFLDDQPLLPDGGLVVDEETISGRAPAHTAGAVALVLRGPLGVLRVPAAFLYAAPPQIDAIEPAQGIAVGGTAVRVTGRNFTPDTRIYFGLTLGTAVALAPATVFGAAEIRGLAPPGQGRASVWALDPELGWSRLGDAFSWVAP